jgi:hypothetical protein
MPAPTITPSDLQLFYQNLLILQYKGRPKAAATVGLLSAQVIADLIYSQVQNGFDISTATGKQLNILGSYVGVYRSVAGFTPSGVSYLQLPGYADAATGFGGFADYSDVVDPSDFWKLYSSLTTAYVLSDGQMGQLISYVIAVHASDHSNASIDLILQKFFGIYATLTDNANMTLLYTHSLSTDPNILFELVNYLGWLPQPAGVTVNVTET